MPALGLFVVLSMLGIVSFAALKNVDSQNLVKENLAKGYIEVPIMIGHNNRNATLDYNESSCPQKEFLYINNMGEYVDSVYDAHFALCK